MNRAAVQTLDRVDYINTTTFLTGDFCTTDEHQDDETGLFAALHRSHPTGNAQNLLHKFPRSFTVDGKVANLLRTC